MVEVQFSEFAFAGIRNLIPDQSRQKSFHASFKWYLERDWENRSVVCPAFADKNLFVFPFGPFRVLFEVDDRVFVWSVSNLTEKPDEFD